MARTKAAARRLSASARPMARQRARKPFKVKEVLPQQKLVDIKKDGQILKAINVRRKSTYFSGRNRLIFFKKCQFVSYFEYSKNIVNENTCSNSFFHHFHF